MFHQSEILLGKVVAVILVDPIPTSPNESLDLKKLLEVLKRHVTHLLYL